MIEEDRRGRNSRVTLILKCLLDIQVGVGKVVGVPGGVQAGDICLGVINQESI